MKKLIYLLAAGSIAFTACQNSPSYKITGTVDEDIADGETVYLQDYDNGELIKLDSAVVQSGTFVFKGQQDSIVKRYITLKKGDKLYFTDLFLENGNINVILGENSKASGTSNNDIYQKFKEDFIALQNDLNEIYKKAQTDTTLTDAQCEAIMQEIEKKDSMGMETVYHTIEANITNPVGISLFPVYAAAYDLDKKKALMDKVPAQYANNPLITKLKTEIEKAEKVAVGQKYIDFSMDTPEGNSVKLSDFVSKNKYTLVDFWASWCGPCRNEMPNVVAAYKEFKDKGFGIVGVSLDDNLENWEAAIKALNITWPQMSDLKGWSNAGAQLYGITSIPATILIDQEGTIIARDLRGDEIKAKLSELLK